MIPGLVLLAVFQLYPILHGFLMSLREWSGVSATQTYVGFDNYLLLLRDEVFWASLWNAAKFGLLAVLIGGALGLAMAWLVYTRPPGATAFRAVFFLPWMLSVVVFGFLWGWMLDVEMGPVNRLIRALGMDNLAKAWLGEPGTAFWAVTFIFIWAYWGFGFLVYLSGLQSIPLEILEAAEVDGANGAQCFRHVIWPLLLPVTVVVTVVTLLLAMQIFGTVLVTTNGGPGYKTEVPTLRIYKEAFINFRVGYAAAMSVVFGVVMISLSFGQVWLGSRYSDESEEA